LLILAQESNPKFCNGLKLCLSPWRKISENALPLQAKSSTHYAIPSISQKLAQDAGYDDALLLDQCDNIAECTVTNIFFGKEGELVTPIADRFLNGITRQVVIEMARNMGIKVSEARLTLDDISKYDTCFMTGTSAEIKGISSIYTGKKTLEFTNDKMVFTLQQEYAKMVGKTL
jgi:branched-chain amino acid aminotransferase